MTLKQWILSEVPDNPRISGQWGPVHIFTLLISISIILLITKKFRYKNERVRMNVIYVLVGIILFFEMTRRIINLIKADSPNINDLLYILLPRPWCAISCWSLIVSAIFKKQYLYNFSCFSALLCALIFFSYPSAGFNNKYLEFENIYSISTHALLLITSITLITLRITNFSYKTIWKELICLGIIFLYAFWEIYVLKISSDPLYFMPGNDVQVILGLPYVAFVPVYIVFIMIYINAFYLISNWNIIKLKFNKKKKQ